MEATVRRLTNALVHLDGMELHAQNAIQLIIETIQVTVYLVQTVDFMVFAMEALLEMDLVFVHLVIRHPLLPLLIVLNVQVDII